MVVVKRIPPFSGVVNEDPLRLDVDGHLLVTDLKIVHGAPPAEGAWQRRHRAAK